MTDKPDGRVHPRAGTRKHSTPVVIEALKASGGIIAIAAQKLQIARQTLHEWINNDPEIAACMAECRELTLDLAEAKLLEAIQAGSEKSVHFVLRTVGKGRGYSERVVLASDPNAPLQVNHNHVHELDLSGLDDAELEALERILSKAEAQPAAGATGAGGA